MKMTMSVRRDYSCIMRERMNGHCKRSALTVWWHNIVGPRSSDALNSVLIETHRRHHVPSEPTDRRTCDVMHANTTHAFW